MAAHCCLLGKETLCLRGPSSLTKDMQAEQLLCWIGKPDTEHITSCSNEAAAAVQKRTMIIVLYKDILFRINQLKIRRNDYIRFAKKKKSKYLKRLVIWAFVYCLFALDISPNRNRFFSVA